MQVRTILLYMWSEPSYRPNLNCKQFDRKSRHCYVITITLLVLRESLKSPVWTRFVSAYNSFNTQYLGHTINYPLGPPFTSVKRLIYIRIYPLVDNSPIIKSSEITWYTVVLYRWCKNFLFSRPQILTVTTFSNQCSMTIRGRNILKKRVYMHL